MIKMSVYKQLLGDRFERMHPKLQHRYATNAGDVFRAKGVMHEISHGSALLTPFYYAATTMDFLFPEEGHDIPFDLEHRCIQTGDDLFDIDWHRNFYFPEKTRQFDSITRVDLATNHAYDLLGKPTMMRSNLLLDVTRDGHLITRTNAQHLLGLVPLPGFFKGKAIVEDGYDDEQQCYTIYATVYNELLGTIIMYGGHFNEI